MMGLDQDDILLAPWTTIKYRVAGVSASTGNQSAAAAATAGTISTAVNSLNALYPESSHQTSLYPQPSVTEQADTPQPFRVANVDQIMAEAASAKEIPQAMQEMTELLHERHHIREGQSDDFNIRDMAE